MENENGIYLRRRRRERNGGKKQHILSIHSYNGKNHIQSITEDESDIQKKNIIDLVDIVLMLCHLFLPTQHCRDELR